MNQRYFNILESNQQLWRIALDIEKKTPANGTIERIMAQVGGPVIYLYVLWVIQEALEKNIKRLYFLARDGQIFFEVAKIICQYGQIDLECKYLYCSRIAWRVPSYCLMGEECLDYICQRSMNLTIQKIFDRTLLSEKQIKDIVKDLKIHDRDMAQILTYGELNNIKAKLRSSSVFMEAVYEKSREEYDNTKMYLLQEGLYEESKFAIVDTGWVGSMQKSLSLLLGDREDMEGFYFGMFKQPKVEKNHYNTYLFSEKTGLWKKIKFNNNLLECMCGATEGMTVKYELKNGVFHPKFANDANINSDSWDVKKNHAIVCNFAECVSREYGLIKISYKESIEISSRLLKTFMMTPTKEEAERFGSYLFSDDITEKGVLELAPYLTQKELFSEDFIPKIWKRLFMKNTAIRQTKSLWIEGSISRNGTCLSPWHRLNAMAWHVLQFGII